jgi:hypothetical protein
LDIHGNARFSGTPWKRGRALRVTAQRSFGARDLLNNALSYPNWSEGILKNRADFERRLETLMAPYYSVSNQTVAEVVSWGIEYRRT